MKVLAIVFFVYLVYLILLEKLHRYVYDYIFQSKNRDFGLPTKYTIANRNNKYEQQSNLILKLYDLVKLSWWRKDIALLPNKKYFRYSR